MKIVHTADLHLRAGGEAQARVAFESFQKVCALAKERHADLLIIAGDAFNSSDDARDGALLNRLRAEFDALAPTRALMIPGNHEFLGSARAYRSASDFGSNCAVFEEAGILKHGKVSVHAFPFKAGATTGQLFASLPAPREGEWRVAVLHGTAVERPNLKMYGVGDEAEQGGDLLIYDADLARAGVRYAALGHVHKPDSWTLPNGGRAAYPGSPWCVTVGEQDERSACVVELDEATGSVRVEAIPLGTPRAERRSFFVMPGNEAETAAKIEEYLRGASAAVWRVAYAKGVADRRALDRLLNEVEERCRAVGPLPAEARRRDRDLEYIEDDALGGVETRFIERMRARIDAATDEDREVLTRAALVGWLALRDPGGKPEDDLIKGIEEGTR